MTFGGYLNMVREISRPFSVWSRAGAVLLLAALALPVAATGAEATNVEVGPTSPTRSVQSAPAAKEFTHCPGSGLKTKNDLTAAHKTPAVSAQVAGQKLQAASDNAKAAGDKSPATKENPKAAGGSPIASEKLNTARDKRRATSDKLKAAGDKSLATSDKAQATGGKEQAQAAGGKEKAISGKSGSTVSTLAAIHSAHDSAQGSDHGAKRHLAARKMLIPPPPPEVPLVQELGQSRSFSTSGVMLEYMSKPDLERMKTRLESALAKAVADKEEQARDIAEKTKRVEQFQQLYKEGVVSRRELETAQHDLDEVQNSGSDIQDRVADDQLDLDRVNKQLQRLAGHKDKSGRH